MDKIEDFNKTLQIFNQIDIGAVLGQCMKIISKNLTILGVDFFENRFDSRRGHQKHEKSVKNG